MYGSSKGSCEHALCAVSPEPSLLDTVISTKISCTGLVTLFFFAFNPYPAIFDIFVVQKMSAYHKGQLCNKFQGKIAIFFLSISLNMCFGCSKGPSH